jgi:hypothetical protein
MIPPLHAHVYRRLWLRLHGDGDVYCALLLAGLVAAVGVIWG